jgi:putative ABC transport system ATP-binding protein
VLKTTSLKYKYPNGESFDFPDFECKEKEHLLVLGSSGVGKSTLLHLLGGLLTTKQGSIELAGQNMTKLSNKSLDQFRGTNIGIIFQNNHFISSLSVLENLLMSQYFSGGKEDESKCKSLLDRLNIGEKAYKPISTLSEGQKQRVAIARALANNPKLILADEPTSALDDDNCKEVISLLEEQAEMAGAALIIVTHDARLKDIISNHITLSNQTTLAK